MKFKYLLILTITLFIGQNSFSQSKKETKNKQKLEEYNATKKMIEDGRVVFKVANLTPYKGSNTQVVGDGVLIEENFLHVNLPFVGNFQAGYTPSNKSNIEFSTDDTIFEVIYNDNKQKIKINFEVVHKTETFTFNMAIYRNGRTNLQVVSNLRSRMVYDGIIESTPTVN
ncbi:DUF4251 domain-containing protein [Urechidicola vernalis]|uniref:DUF4251 domain-containing protein n=1 Tax=Urechidicola vernalis TaxID=3075600 RepID=A0ABU2Y6W8_9FLAO|nr:DUF4251 domain-containing protein [Urechidicola sp. P050]MDT0553379.1 DUF4251 domain-containing protein [Urechidicola sp. P050]